jgi:predicted RNase H-like HicB family nuclease
MKFNIICEIDEEGRYVIEYPDLPGCFSEGNTLEVAMENINEAIIGCLASRLKTAKEELLKNDACKSQKMSIFLDTNKTAEYA